MTETKPSTRWKIIESVPDKNNVILLGIRESPDGDFSTRDDALAAIHYAHSAGGSRQRDPSYQDLVDHIRWTQNLWRHGIEIMRKNNLVIASDTPMEKLAFTFYNDLCEIDWRALHLFGEGPGDENYKDQSAIQTQGIVPYPRPYEEVIRKDEREKVLDIINEENNARLKGLEILFATPADKRAELAQDVYLKEAYFELTLVKHLIESLYTKGDEPE